MKEKFNRIKLFISLHLLLMLFSISTICSKKASAEEVFSLLFFIYYGLVIVLLGIYAIFWQQIIKRLPLATAYANKAVTVIWGMLWGALLFHEKISYLKIIGAILIVAGIIFYSFEDDEEKKRGTMI